MFKNVRQNLFRYSRRYSEYSEKSRITGLRDKESLLKMTKTKLPPPVIEASFSNFDMKTPLSNFSTGEIEPITHFRQEDIKITRFPNKLRVATLDTHSNNSNITILFRAGTRFENKHESGLANMINKLSFQESENFTHDQLENAKDKVIYESDCDAEITNYHITFFRQDLENAVSLISDSILGPKFNEENIQEVKEGLALSYEDQLENPVMTAIAREQLYKSCFGETVLGKTQLALNPGATRSQLFEFVRKYYRPERCVIVGVNVDDTAFLNLIEKYFVFSNSAYNQIDEFSIWSGGEQRYTYLETPNEVMKQNIPALTSVALSFQGWANSHKDIYAAHVLESILGGGDSFSAGGPGKGLSSIIHTRYLTQFDFYSMKCEHKALSDNGMFTLSASCVHANAEQLLGPLVHCYSNMIRPGFIKEEDLMSGKNRFKSVILGVLEDIHGLATNLAYDILYLDQSRSGVELCKKIDAVTMDDIKRISIGMMKTRPAMSVIGDCSKVATYPLVEDYFRKLDVDGKKH
jgi:processing peptidase subunit alpha